jgi:hypothetical protein
MGSIAGPRPGPVPRWGTCRGARAAQRPHSCRTCQAPSGYSDERATTPAIHGTSVRRQRVPGTCRPCLTCTRQLPGTARPARRLTPSAEPNPCRAVTAQLSPVPGTRRVLPPPAATPMTHGTSVHRGAVPGRCRVRTTRTRQLPGTTEGRRLATPGSQPDPCRAETAQVPPVPGTGRARRQPRRNARKPRYFGAPRRGAWHVPRPLDTYPPTTRHH